VHFPGGGREFAPEVGMGDFDQGLGPVVRNFIAQAVA
jgi:hypothetical protein